MNPIDTKLIRKFFDTYIYVKNHCAEVRIFNARVDRQSNRIVRQPRKSRFSTTVAGWFDRSDELACELSRVENCSCYITVNPASLSRRPVYARNKLQILRHEEFVLDQDITFCRYLIIDIDPIRDEKRTR